VGDGVEVRDGVDVGVNVGGRGVKVAVGGIDVKVAVGGADVKVGVGGMDVKVAVGGIGVKVGVGVKGTGAKARRAASAWITPAPYWSVGPRPCSAVWAITASISSGEASGRMASNSPASPATCGAAIEVPSQN
jgi:hypothetical protein